MTTSCLQGQSNGHPQSALRQSVTTAQFLSCGLDRDLFDCNRAEHYITKEAPSATSELTNEVLEPPANRLYSASSASLPSGASLAI
jgi:hypothetical protein